jgi:acetolactate synthase-1/2/3 large subunit
MKRFTSRALAVPGPVVVDIPKDVQFATGNYVGPVEHPAQDLQAEAEAVRLPHRGSGRSDGAGQEAVFYTGGGVINSGNKASKLLRELVR